MYQYHRSHEKKVKSGTGGRRSKSSDKKLCHTGGVFSATKVGATTKTVIRTMGGARRTKLKKAEYVNVRTNDGKMKKAKISAVVESPYSEYVRQNIITKGAVLQTEVGKVKVTNRVGQDGAVNGVLLE